MSQPDWDAAQVEYDVFLCWKMTVDAVDYTFKYALNRTVDHNVTGTWNPRPGVSPEVSTVDLRGTWLGALTSLTNLTQSVGGNIDPKISFPTVTATISRMDADDFDNLLTVIDGSKMMTSPRAWIGIFIADKGTSINTSTDLVFIGVPDPGGVVVSSDSVKITISDSMKYYSDVDVCTETYLTTEFPNLDISKEGTPIPVMYGKFEDTVPFAPTILEVVRVDTTGDLYSICRPGAFGVDFVFAQFGMMILHMRADGTAALNTGGGTDHNGIYQVQDYVVPLTSESDSSGIVEAYTDTGVSAPEAYAEGDKYYLILPYALSPATPIYGNLDADSAAIEGPVDIIYDLMTQYGNIPSSQIDSSYSDTATSISGFVNNLCKRVIKERTKIFDLIQEICNEFNIIFTVKNGKFFIKTGKIWADKTSILTLYPSDILKDSLQLAVDAAWVVSSGFQAAAEYTQGVYPTPLELSYFDGRFIDGTVTTFAPIYKGNDTDFWYNRIMTTEASDTGQKTNLEYKWPIWSNVAEWLTEQKNAAIGMATNEAPKGVTCKVIKRLMDPAYGVGDVVSVRLPDSLGGATIPVQIYSISRDFRVGITEIKGYPVTLEAV